MIYKNSDIPSNYNKIAEISDNYIVWVREDLLHNDDSYSAYIQYFNPSFYYVFVDDYVIKNGNNVTYIANYNNNGMYSYLESYDVEYSLNTIETTSGDIVIDNDFYRSDHNSTFLCGMVLVLIFVLVCVRLLPHTRR